MKTSYVYKHSKGETEQQSVQESTTQSRVSASDTYMYLREKSKEMAIERKQKAKEPVQAEVSEPVEDTSKKKKKGKAGVIIGVSLAVLVAGSVGGVFAYKSYTAKVLNENYVAFCENVAAAYLADPLTGMNGMTKEGIDTLRNTLDEYSIKGIDTSDISLKIVDMSLYLEDTEKVSALKDENRSLSESVFAEELSVVQASIDSEYTVDSFKSVLQGEVDSLQNQLTVYAYIKEQMLAVTDVSSITSEFLSAEIDSLDYVEDIGVFNSLKDKMLVLQDCQKEYQSRVDAYNSAVAELEALSAVQYDENGKEVKLSKQEKADKEEAIAAQQGVVDAALQVVIEYKETLRGTELSLAQAQDSLAGVSSYIETLNTRWAEEDAVSELENEVEDIVE